MAKEKKIKDNKTQSFKIIMIIIVTIFVTIMLTTLTIFLVFINGKQIGKYILVSNYEGNKQISDDLNELRTVIDKYYLGDIDEEELKEGAMKGYVAGLKDKYAAYITKDEMAEYMEDVNGNFTGIGIYMTTDNKKDLIKVMGTMKDSPAEKSGIKEGDLILKVDGVEYTASDFNNISKKIKGQAGTTVKLEILRNEAKLEFELKREEIVVNKTTGKVIEGNIGYIEIPSFDDGTSKEFKEEYAKLAEQGINSLIIDLRGNGGGIVKRATEIADYIADKGSVLLYEIDKYGSEIVTKSEQDPIVNVPIVVLVDEETASASEILAGALQDLKKATIVGVDTYGKGIIQTVLKLPDGDGLKLTTEEYNTPNRTKINKVGIKPDVVVQLEKKEEDNQLQKAIELLK